MSTSTTYIWNHLCNIYISQTQPPKLVKYFNLDWIVLYITHMQFVYNSIIMEIQDNATDVNLDFWKF